MSDNGTPDNEKDQPPSWHEFTGDIGSAARAWRSAPTLPLVSLVLWGISGLPPQDLWPLVLPIAVASIGWFGSERIWYLRIFRGLGISERELIRFTFAFLWRYLKLGILAGLLWIPVVFIVFDAIRENRLTHDDFQDPAVFVAVAVGAIVTDLVLTFVTPALAFSTRSVIEALKVGIRFLRAEWPRSAWYALVPPLAIVLLMHVLRPPDIDSPARVLMGGAAVLLNLAFKGATAAFYLRRVRVGDDGAAWARGGFFSPALPDAGGSPGGEKSG